MTRFIIIKLSIIESQLYFNVYQAISHFAPLKTTTSVTEPLYHASYLQFTMKDEDKHIIKLIKNGEVTAFAQLIDRYQQMAFTLALSIVKNREDAQEITQDAFMKAYRSLADFREQSRFSSWLYRIVYNTAISGQRLKKDAFLDIDSTAAKYSSENRVEASDKLETRDRKVLLKQAIAQLDEDDAFIIILYYYKELSIEEIQQITGISNSNIKVKLHRSRKRLFQTLEHTLKSELPDLL